MNWHTLKPLVAFLLGSGLLLAGTPTVADPIMIYVHTDHLGSPVAETDSVGTAIKRQSYSSYGEDEQSATPDGPGYTGHRNDAATDLVYMQARYYDPVIGRFLSVDPVTFSSDKPQQFNRYWYANGNPYLFFDPTGMLGELLNPDQKGPNMVLVNDDQGNQMYVPAGVASDTLLATSLGTTTGDINTVTESEKATVVVILGAVSIVGSELAGAVLLGMGADALSDKVEAGTATAADVAEVLPLGKAAKVFGASDLESKLIDAVQVMDTVSDMAETGEKNIEDGDREHEVGVDE